MAMPKSRPAGGHGHAVYSIGGISVEFPHKAYASQLAFMGKVIAALHKSPAPSHALLESPTGTGKSLALLCSTLAWQRHVERCGGPSREENAPARGGGDSGGGGLPKREVPERHGGRDSRDDKPPALEGVFLRSSRPSRDSRNILENGLATRDGSSRDDGPASENESTKNNESSQDNNRTAFENGFAVNDAPSGDGRPAASENGCMRNERSLRDNGIRAENGLMTNDGSSRDVRLAWESGFVSTNRPSRNNSPATHNELTMNNESSLDNTSALENGLMTNNRFSRDNKLHLENGLMMNNGLRNNMPRLENAFTWNNGSSMDNTPALDNGFTMNNGSSRDNASARHDGPSIHSCSSRDTGSFRDNASTWYNGPCKSSSVNRLGLGNGITTHNRPSSSSGATWDSVPIGNNAFSRDDGYALHGPSRDNGSSMDNAANRQPVPPDPFTTGGGFIIEDIGPGGGFITEDEAAVTATGNPQQACQLPAKGSKQKDKQIKVPTIFYATRTHSQISQVIREYRKTNYRVQMAVLAARKHYCTNKHVYKKTNVDEECKRLLKDPDCSCPQFRNASKVKSHPSLRKGGVHEVHDIEDLVSIAHSVKGCAYFGARAMALDAQIVFCPYGYILNPMIRKAMEINLQGTIIVFDEAHNIEDIAREAGSIDVETGVLEVMRSELEQLCASASVPDFYQPLLDMVQEMLGWIHQQASRLERLDFENYCSWWTGRKAIQELQCAGISLQYFPILLECANKAIAATLDVETETNYLSGLCTSTLEGLFSSLKLMLSNNGQRVDDYRLVVRRYVKRDQAFGVVGWSCSVSLWCLNPAVIFQEIASQAHSIILSSGTLSPMGSFSSELGVPFEICMEAPHVINTDKQILAMTVSVGPGRIPLNASYKHADSYTFQDALGTALEEFFKVSPDGALIFFPSYKLMEKLCNRWKVTGQWTKLLTQKKLFVEPRGSQDDFESMLNEYYDTFREVSTRLDPKKWEKVSQRKCFKIQKQQQSSTSQNGGALFAVCRGKVSEGIDFSDRNARLVVVIGIPFPNKKDIQVSLKKQYNNENKISKNLLSGDQWYCYQAFRALNQAVGRCIRHQHDYGAIILVDERFRKSSNLEYMSKWLRNSIRNVNSFEESLEGLQNFFEKTKGWTYVPNSKLAEATKNSYQPSSNSSRGSNEQLKASGIASLRKMRKENVKNRMEDDPAPQNIKNKFRPQEHPLQECNYRQNLVSLDNCQMRSTSIDEDNVLHCGYPSNNQCAYSSVFQPPLPCFSQKETAMLDSRRHSGISCVSVLDPQTDCTPLPLSKTASDFLPGSTYSPVGSGALSYWRQNDMKISMECKTENNSIYLTKKMLPRRFQLSPAVPMQLFSNEANECKSEVSDVGSCPQKLTKLNSIFNVNQSSDDSLTVSVPGQHFQVSDSTVGMLSSDFNACTEELMQAAEQTCCHPEGICFCPSDVTTQSCSSFDVKMEVLNSGLDGAPWKNFNIFCCRCKSSLGSPDKMNVTAYETNLKKSFLQNLMELNSAFMNVQGLDCTRLLVSESSSLNSLMFSSKLEDYPDSNLVKARFTKARGVWVDVDGCVFKPLSCPWCEDHSFFIGAYVLAVDRAFLFLDAVTLSASASQLSQQTQENLRSKYSSSSKGSYQGRNLSESCQERDGMHQMSPVKGGIEGCSRRKLKLPRRESNGCT